MFLQLYGWLHSVVDVHINAVLTALEESGQADNTIVIFLADHGEYGAAHGMMLEKWYTAYQEVVHVPVVVKFPASGAKRRPPENGIAPEPRQLDALTSHVDILPTVLGFANVHAEERREISGSWPQTGPCRRCPASICRHHPARSGERWR